MTPTKLGFPRIFSSPFREHFPRLLIAESPLARLWQVLLPAKLAPFAMSLLLLIAASFAGTTTVRAVDFYLTLGSGDIYKYTPPKFDGVFASGLSYPEGAALDSAGNLYVGDASNNIYKFTPTGAKSTFASGLNNPFGLAFDHSGNLYEADYSSGNIYKFTSSGAKSTFASGLNRPKALALDSAGNLYVTTDSNNVVKIAPSGIQSIFATVQCPFGVALDAANNVYVSQGAGCASLGGPPVPVDILKFTPSGASTVFSTAVTAPQYLAFDPTGNLYVSDLGDHSQTGGSVLMFAPNGTRTVFSSGLNFPAGIAFPYSGSTSSSGQLLNVSTRLDVLTGSQVAIGGFIIKGSANKQVLVRALGPTLASFGVTGVLADPVLTLHHTDAQGHDTVVETNDNWKTPNQTAIQATGKAPPNDAEAAILKTLAPGNYTAIVTGKGSNTGVALVEAYDLDQSASTTLTNISTRGFAGTGNNAMIGGFISGGNGSTKVIVRVLGPTLSQFGVTGVLADPRLELRDANGGLLGTNDDWAISTQAAEIRASGYAPPSGSEPAIIITRPAGNTTALVTGRNNTAGNALVEVYTLAP